MNELVKRMKFTEQTKEKFFGKPFAWGSCDCGKIAAFHMRKFGWKVPPTGRYKNLIGARKNLKELGCSTIEQLVTKIGLKEIPASFTMVGDIVSFQSDADTGAIGIVIGNGNMLAFHESAIGLAVVSMTNIDKAWSVSHG